MKPSSPTFFCKVFAGSEGTGFSSEIETKIADIIRGDICTGSEGTGFSSEIETFSNEQPDIREWVVARELASRLRLKQMTVIMTEEKIYGSEGTGFSSEIETSLAIGQEQR